MTKEEILILLGTVASIDNRFGRKSVEEIQLQAAAWSGVLSNGMPLNFALEQVRKHYAKSTNVLMPADLEMPWRSVRDHEMNLTRTKQLEESKLPRNGMPAHVRAKLTELGILKP